MKSNIPYRNTTKYAFSNVKFTISSIQSTITRHVKKQENVLNSKEKYPPTETDRNYRHDEMNRQRC